METKISPKHYLITAISQWLIDSALTPHLIVELDESTPVDMPDFLKSVSQVVFNIHPNAVSGYICGVNGVEFYARFSGVEHRVNIPLSLIVGVRAQETGQGVFFDKTSSGDSIAQLDGASTMRADTPAKQNKKEPEFRVIK